MARGGQSGPAKSVQGGFSSSPSRYSASSRRRWPASRARSTQYCVRGGTLLYHDSPAPIHALKLLAAPRPKAGRFGRTQVLDPQYRAWAQLVMSGEDFVHVTDKLPCTTVERTIAEMDVLTSLSAQAASRSKYELAPPQPPSLL